MAAGQTSRTGGDTGVILDSLRRIVRDLRVTARSAERATGLSAAQLFVLQALLDHPAASVNELAERTYTHQSSVSVVVTRLTRKGLVTRKTAAEDARRSEIALTRKGERSVRKAREPTQVRLVEGVTRLAPAQRRALAEGLEALVARMGLTRAPPAMFFEEELRNGQPPRKRAPDPG